MWNKGVVMWYVYFFDEIRSFETEKLALEYASKLVNSGELLADIKLIQGTEIKLKAIEVTTKVVRA
jgi:hypothetical protein